MPRYYFDIQDNTGLLQDKVGDDLADDSAATSEAIHIVTSIARDCVDANEPLAVNVRSDHQDLFKVTLTIAIDRPSRE